LNINDEWSIAMRIMTNPRIQSMAAMRRTGRHCKLAAMNRQQAIWMLPFVLATACGDDEMMAGDSGAPDARADTGATDTAMPPSDSSAGDGGSTTCTAFADAIELGNVESTALNEISGVAASRANADVLWVHNDSGDSARIFALRTDGTHLGEYGLSGASHVDWEDMALGPGPEVGRDYLYLGDVGDNAARDTGVGRSGVTVYRVPEPTVDRDQTPVTMDLASVESLPLAYPEGPHDCEALMVDPASGDLYLLTKENDGMSELYMARAPLVADATTTLERVAELPFGPGATPGGPFATGGDLSPDGDALLVRTYSAVLLFLRPAGGTIADALTGDAVELPAAFERQGEGIAWAPDGLGYYTLSEFADAPVHFYAAEASCVP
jgi:hypothetical protein